MLPRLLGRLLALRRRSKLLLCRTPTKAMTRNTCKWGYGQKHSLSYCVFGRALPADSAERSPDFTDVLVTVPCQPVCILVATFEMLNTQSLRRRYSAVA